jgi:aspartate racemase
MKTIGLIGGMGPLATTDLYEKIISLTDAHKDQEHIHVIIDSNTEIPDRTTAILHHSEDPVFPIVRSAINLENSGCDVLIMACNTAHYYYDVIKKFVHIPFINMITETASEAKKRGYKKCALLATDGTCQTGIYDKEFEKQNIELIKPNIDDQKAVMELIYDGVKAGNKDLDTSKFLASMDHLKSQGAQAFILGCTELPVAVDMYSLKGSFINPTEILARRAIEFAGVKPKEN